MQQDNNLSEQSCSTHVLVVGQTPPPYHGQAIAIAELVKADWPDISVSHVRLAYSKSAKEIGRFSFAKVWHLLHCAGVSIHELRRTPGMILYYPPGGSLVSIIRDIVFLLIVRPFAAKLVLHFHSAGMDEVLSHHRWLKIAAGWAYGGCNAAITLSPSLLSDAECLFPKRIETVPNGLDVPIVYPSPSSADKRVRLLFVGIHTEEKGLLIVLEAVRRLREMGVDLCVHTMGSWLSDDDELLCRQLWVEYDLEDCVTFMGTLTGKAKWQEYADADILFFPTFYRAELMPLVIIEAMAFSLPVVSSCWRGIQDMVVDEVTGLLFPAKDIDAAVRQLVRLLRDPDLRLKMGEAARVRYEGNYTLAKHLNAMHDVFRAVV